MPEGVRKSESTDYAKLCQTLRHWNATWAKHGSVRVHHILGHGIADGACKRGESTGREGTYSPRCPLATQALARTLCAMLHKDGADLTALLVASGILKCKKGGHHVLNRKALKRILSTML